MTEKIICAGCGIEITDRDTPNVVIGKEPLHFCMTCTKYGSIVSQMENGKWLLEPIIPVRS